MKTTATLFSGFEGVGIGAINAGLTHLWGVEFDADIAAVAETNGFKTIVADVRAVDYATLERPWHLHASPVCKNASTAKTNGEESPVDIATANAVCEALLALRPTLFTLENVRGYQDFTAFKNIMRTAWRLGYQIAHDVLNAANFGVPQTRERLIVVARNDGKRPQMPETTHAEFDKLAPLFETRLRWRGWYESVEDLLPGCPDSQFAPWQLKRLPAELSTSQIVAEGGFDGTVVRRDIESPVFAITANQNQMHLKAWLVGDGDQWRPIAEHDRPATTLSAKNGFRAYPVNEPLTMEIRNADQPTATQVASPSRARKAFIVPGSNASSFDVREADAPARTVGDTERVGNAPRASINGRVVKMIPRCLARFQSFPDSYALPESARLATTGIGNAVPPLLMQRVLEANL